MRGPWLDTGVFASNAPPIYRLDNPTAVHLGDGTTLVMGRSWNKNEVTQLWNSTIGIARSDGPTWNTTYTTLPEGYPQYTNITEKVPPGEAVQLEDPFMWTRKDANTGDVLSWHALFHNMGGCGSSVGCHAFSEDSFVWRMSSSGAYDMTLEFDDGTSKTVARRERPHILFNRNGDPAFLTNGVQDVAGREHDHTWTHVQPIDVEWP